MDHAPMPAGGRTADRPVDTPCPACGELTLAVFFEEGNVPTNSCLLLDDPAEASGFWRGELAIASCTTCGFLTNTAFTPGQAEYSQRYEETQGFSPRFMVFAQELAQRWVSDYDLHDRTVLEIGCGKGEFLIEMAKAGAGQCIGIDPGVHPERIDDPAAADIEWIADFYDERYAHLDADVVICRHTLEHIPDVAEFMTTIRQAIGDRPETVVLFELPDVQRVLDEVAFWDIYYEHCSYFSLGSLARLFRRTGFEVVELSMEYDGQYLLIAARPSTVPAAGEPLAAEDDLERLRQGVDHFRRGYDELVGGWRERIADLNESGGRAVIWGSGSKGVSFISNLALGDELAAAVDINPHKWGKFMVGSNHEIVAPERLVEIAPDLVVAMNPIYIDEIGAHLRDLGVDTELTAALIAARMTRPTDCPVCGSEAHEDVLSLARMPVLVNAQVRPECASSVSRGDIDLVVCVGCGHLFNRSFDASLLAYDAAYENTLHYSKQFQNFARGLASRLVTDHGLAGTTVAELGSGPGHFLSMLCEAGAAEGRGFDPSYDPDRLGAPDHSRVSISTDMFPDDGSLQVRLALSQHVLEHLPDPITALVALRSAVDRTNGVVYSEVPNGRLMLDKCALWDLIYEHLSYFVPTSLELACRRAGLEVTTMGAAFGDQFLWCEASPARTAGDGPDPEAVTAAVAAARAFGVAAEQRITEARQDLAELASDGPVVLWGAGSKGMTYLNLVADVAPVAAVVDINPRKAGWGVPGTSLVISGPDIVADLSPSTVLAANPVYVGEIEAMLAERGADAEVRALWG